MVPLLSLSNIYRADLKKKKKAEISSGPCGSKAPLAMEAFSNTERSMMLLDCASGAGQTASLVMFPYKMRLSSLLSVICNPIPEV